MALVVFALALPAVAVAQDVGSIRGVVRDAGGAPLPGVTVAALLQRALTPPMTVTNPIGQYKPLVQTLAPRTVCGLTVLPGDPRLDTKIRKPATVPGTIKTIPPAICRP